VASLQLEFPQSQQGLVATAAEKEAIDDLPQSDEIALGDGLF